MIQWTAWFNEWENRPRKSTSHMAYDLQELWRKHKGPGLLMYSTLVVSNTKSSAKRKTRSTAELLVFICYGTLGSTHKWLIPLKMVVTHKEWFSRDPFHRQPHFYVMQNSGFIQAARDAHLQLTHDCNAKGPTQAPAATRSIIPEGSKCW